MSDSEIRTIPQRGGKGGYPIWVDNMTISEVVQQLNVLNDEETIYVMRPWTISSLAIVAPEPEAGGPPYEAKDHGLDYFLEVSVAREVLEDFKSISAFDPTLGEQCERLIQYAKNDA